MDQSHITAATATATTTTTSTTTAAAAVAAAAVAVAEPAPKRPRTDVAAEMIAISVKTFFGVSLSLRISNTATVCFISSHSIPSHYKHTHVFFYPYYSRNRSIN